MMMFPYQQSVMHSIKIGKQAGINLTDSKERLSLLNKIRIKYVQGFDDDPISKKVKELLN